MGGGTAARHYCWMSSVAEEHLRLLDVERIGRSLQRFLGPRCDCCVGCHNGRNGFVTHEMETNATTGAEASLTLNKLDWS